VQYNDKNNEDRAEEVTTLFKNSNGLCNRSLCLKIKVVAIFNGTYKDNERGIDSKKKIEFPFTQELVVGWVRASSFFF